MKSIPTSKTHPWLLLAALMLVFSALLAPMQTVRAGTIALNTLSNIDASLPGAFGKTSPANGANPNPTNPTLSWRTSSGAKSYVFCIDMTNNNTCDGSWVNVGTSTSTDLSGLRGDTTYYWQVIARGADITNKTEADGGVWWSFTTRTPGEFGKSGPAKGATNVSTSPTLSWGSSSHADAYEYCISTTNGGTCHNPGDAVGNWTATTPQGSTSVHLSGLLPGTTYYWQVRAIAFGWAFANGGTWWSFTTIYALPPNNVQASDGTYTDKVLVSWNASSGATSYKVYRAASASGTKSSLGSPTGTSFNDTTATPGVTYTYWVKTCKVSNCSDYSASNTGWRKLSAPTNLQASDGTYTTKVLVSWNASSGATYYKIYRATSASGTKTLLGGPTGTSFNDTTAIAGATHIYYYWVMAYRGTSCSGYSAPNTGWRKH